MRENQRDRSCGTEFARHRVNILNVDSRLDFLRRHAAHLDAAEKISGEQLKMASDEAAQFRQRFFAPESDGGVVQRQSPIFGQSIITKKSKNLADSEDGGQRKGCDGRRG